MATVAVFDPAPLNHIIAYTVCLGLTAFFGLLAFKYLLR